MISSESNVAVELPHYMIRSELNDAMVQLNSVSGCFNAYQFFIFYKIIFYVSPSMTNTFKVIVKMNPHWFWL